MSKPKQESVYSHYPSKSVAVYHIQQQILYQSALDWPAREERMMPTIRPYKAKASAKMRMRIIPTKSFGC